MLRRLMLALAFATALPAFVHAQEAPATSLRERILERIQARRATPADEATGTAAWQQPGTHRFTLQFGGQARGYLVHVPPQYRPGTPMPVVVALHGGGGSMEIQASTHYALVDKADAAGFLAVFPNGYSRLPGGKLATWNAGRCCGAARDTGSDDVGFVRAVLAQVEQRWSVDRRRVFATGMSNGAMMAYRLACDMSDRFAAIAAVAGTDNTSSCQPGQSVAVLHIHAQDDTHVLFNGGAGPDAFRDPQAVTAFTSVPETLRRWAAHNHCSSTPQRTLDVPGAYCDSYPSCAAPVQLCVTDSGGHSWPGGSKVRAAGTAPSQALHATDMAWDFFVRAVPSN